MSRKRKRAAWQVAGKVKEHENLSACDEIAERLLKILNTTEVFENWDSLQMKYVEMPDPGHNTILMVAYVDYRMEKNLLHHHVSIAKNQANKFIFLNPRVIHLSYIN